MTTYRRYVETNDHEGEQWTFWLQVDGNSDALAILECHLDRVNKELGRYDDPAFVLKVDEIEGHEVDLLVRFGEVMYMHQHNKVDGVMRLPKDFTSADLEATTDWLYKGGIKKFFTDGGAE